MDSSSPFTAFVGPKRIASGALRDVLVVLKARFDTGDPDLVLVFDDETGRQVDFDLRGTMDDVLARVIPPRGPGRPKLGVVGREVSLLPKHWTWLEDQPSGASAALRRLVEAAMKAAPGADRARKLRAATHHFMTAMAGNLPKYEEASRALFGKDQARFEKLVAKWPADVRAHVVKMSREAARSEGAAA